MNILAVMLIRLLLTSIHVFFPESIIWTLVLLLGLDILDEHIDVIGYRPVFTFDYIPSTMNWKERMEYEKADKVVDVIQYMIALCFVDNIIPNYWKPYVYFAFVIRLVGVTLFVYTEKKIFLHIFTDVVKEILLAVAFLGKDYANVYTVLCIYVLKAIISFGYFHNKVMMDI